MAGMEQLLPTAGPGGTSLDGRRVAAVERLLSREGRLADDPADPGGITNYGVSIRYLKRLSAADRRKLAQAGLAIPSQVTADTIRNLMRSDATIIYSVLWWDALEYGALPDPIAAKTLDLAVNMGPVQGHRLVQRACRAHGRKIADDGDLGPISRDTIAAIGPDLIHAIRSEAAGYYRLLAATTQFGGRFLGGWLARAYDEDA
ncbi:glycosyl hydrolase 108 family protein [Tistrella bauzanensis]|uniref:glycoside hydrolase family 108 protein n=1 Tax=Tistrella TaxID=171436 RepID=UPI0031F5FDE3